MTPTSLLKQPLLHFLLIGGLIFVAYGFNAEPDVVEPEADLGKQIVVDREALLNFMQYQAQAFDAGLFAERLDAMAADEVAALIQDYVREEVLYREAQKMNMDEGDYIIRQRLVEKVEFLLENLAATSSPPTDAELQAWYQERLDDYRVDAVYDFTHIFFDARQGGIDAARARAEALLAESNDFPAEQAEQHGDRFPFLQNYAGRTRDFVVNNFSAAFVDALDELAPAERWQGPLESRYGQHLVLLQGRTEPFTPPLQDIRAQVLADYRYEALIRSREAAEEEVVAGYEVTVALDQDEPRE